MTLPDGETQRKLREYAVPRWGYRLGADGQVESEVFDTDLPAGWYDSPAKVRDRTTTRASETAPWPPHSAELMAPEDADGPAAAPPSAPPPDYSTLSVPKLNKLLKEKTGAGAPPGTTKADLLDMLRRAG